jgi:hypothetical protein
MSKFLHFNYLKDRSLAGLKSPENKEKIKDYKLLIDNSSIEILNPSEKLTVSDKTYKSKYYLMSMAR